MSTDFQYIRYEGVENGVARIALARPDKRNAQNKTMLYELNDALDLAAHDDDCKVILVSADGPDFSSGHDMKDREPMTHKPVGTWGGFRQPGIEGHWAFEEELYLGFCWRWRNIPKPTMVQVQGRVIAGGLMLVWPMDLIVVSEDATFSDPVVAFGVNGHEYFVHPFEAGARLAKEMLFTGRALSAQELFERGMVNKVVPRDELESATVELAAHIAKRPMFGLTLAKQSVNNTLDAQGMWTSIQSAFGLHHVAHSSNMQVHGMLVDPTGLKVIRDEA